MTNLVSEKKLDPPPPWGISETYISKKPIQIIYIAGAFALEGQLKVGTSLNLGVGVTFSKWGWYGHL